MAVRDRTELLAALERGDFDAVIGTPEDQGMEFKEEPYVLDKPKGPYE
jgi:hypothetical protein